METTCQSLQGPRWVCLRSQPFPRVWPLWQRLSFHEQRILLFRHPFAQAHPSHTGCFFQPCTSSLIPWETTVLFLSVKVIRLKWCGINLSTSKLWLEMYFLPTDTLCICTFYKNHTRHCGWEWKRKFGGSSTLLEMLHKAWFNLGGQGGEQIFKIVLQHASFKR